MDRRARLAEQQRRRGRSVEQLRRRRPALGVAKGIDAEDDVVLRLRRDDRAFGRRRDPFRQQPKVMIEHRREVGRDVDGRTEKRELVPRRVRRRIEAHAQRHHPEIEDPRRHLGVTRAHPGHLHLLVPEDHRKRWVRDLQRLRLAANGAHARRCARGQQIERTVEADLVRDVVQPVDDRTAIDAEHRRRHVTCSRVRRWRVEVRKR